MELEQAIRAKGITSENLSSQYVIGGVQGCAENDVAKEGEGETTCNLVRGHPRPVSLWSREVLEWLSAGSELTE